MFVINRKTEMMLENRQKVDFHHNWSIVLNCFGLWGNHATLNFAPAPISDLALQSITAIFNDFLINDLKRRD
jgi:hypothetical protein